MYNQVLKIRNNEMTGANISNDVSTCRVTCSDNNTLSSQTADKRG